MPSSPSLESGGGIVKLELSCNGQTVASTTQIVSITVKKTLNRIPYAELIILDGDMPNKDFPVSNSDDFKPGSAVKISAGYGTSQVAVIFEGIVVKHGIKITRDNYSRLVVECRDKAVAMTVGRKNANYVDSKDSDIISKLIGNYSSLTADVTATSLQYKELVQYYCSDWDFMLSRAEVNGYVVTVDAAKVSVKAPDTSTAAALKVTYGFDIVEFHAHVDARNQYSKVQSVAWDVANQAIVQQQASPASLNSQGDLSSSTLASVLGLSAYRLQTPASLESSALKSWADGQQLKSGLSRIQGRMKFQGNAKAKCGTLVELEGVGNRFNGSVYVSSVQHVIEDGNWLTEVEFGLPAAWFADNRDLVVPPASGWLPGVEGLHIGVVKKLDADPEGQYKVQVSIPLLQADTDGVWARLSKFYASDGFGTFFIPEIGDEVLLGYLNNDPSNPVILGSLYSSKRKPAYELTANNYKKAIVTKTKLKLEFDDEKKIITLLTPGNNTIVISDDGKSILLKDQNNNQVKLSDSGILLDSPKDITISAKGKVSISAVGNIELDSKAEVTVDATTNASINAKVSLTAKGSASAEFSSPGSTTIKGAMVNIN